MTEQLSTSYPVLPLRDIVVFPHMIVPLFVGREKSVRALEAVMREDKQILLVAQKNALQDDPGAKDLFETGTVSTVLQPIYSLLCFKHAHVTSPVLTVSI